jgi:hypothetical protein
MAIAAPRGGEVRADSVYALGDFQRLTGLGAKSIRKARSEGLIVTRVGRRSYVRGADWLDYLAVKAGAQQ